ncbi:MAG: hypothetical protein IRZ00_09500, partial [Gemmatimonadetes bacterium]|nr:hypothetical protein [Gemmatimonadota bacterium]
MTLVALVALAVVGHAAQPYAPSPDRPSLVGLRIDPAPGRTEISIVVDGAPPIRVREPLILDDRARVEIEIPGAAIRVNRPIYVGPPTGGILALRAMSGAGGARVLIDLPVGRRYDVHTAPNGLLVTIENHGAPATLWITGVRGYGSPPRIVPAAAPPPVSYKQIRAHN